MPWKRNVLVVAKRTAASDDLVQALKAMADRTPSEFTLLVPATSVRGGRNEAVRSLQEALERFRAADLEAAGQIGDSDPCLAVSEVWDPRRFDEIVVCTLPLGSSKWLHAGLPERIGKLTGAPVTHVVSHPRAPVAEPAQPPSRNKPLGPILSPFSALGHTEDRQHVPQHSRAAGEDSHRL